MKKKTIPVYILALAAAPFALANTPADNVIWSAKPVAANDHAPECTAYSGHPIANSPPAEPVESTLKLIGTLAATAALSAGAHYGGAAPNPCRPGGL